MTVGDSDGRPLRTDCCHTSIAIEHNRGSGCNASSSGRKVGRGSVSGCPGEYYALTDIRREIFAADPYHLVFGTVARCYGDGVWYGPLHNRSVAHPFLLAAFHSKFIGEQ